MPSTFLPEYKRSISRWNWDDIRERVDSFWVPKKAPHHSLIAQTRGGKSYLMSNGILPMVERENVLIIDVKGDDETLAGVGKAVSKIPPRSSRTFNDWMSEGKPREHWYRLIVKEDWTDARNQVGKALQTCYKEGSWNIVLDETRALTETRIPSLNLGPYVEQMWLRGGSRGICVIAATQGPRWVPRSFYEQAQFHWIGVVEDEDSQKRLREIGGMERHHLEVIKNLEKYHWVYTDRLEDERFRAITKVE